MRRLRSVAALVLAAFLLLGASGCFTLEHEVGAGAQGRASVQERQWYALWGLVPINRVDSKAMAAGAQDYTIETQLGVVDILLNIVTSWVTVYSRTVKVTP